jgi:hypothetical protein
VTVLDRMMSVAEDRPALTPLGAARSTLRSPKRAFALLSRFVSGTP